MVDLSSKSRREDRPERSGGGSAGGRTPLMRPGERIKVLVLLLVTGLVVALLVTRLSMDHEPAQPSGPQDLKPGDARADLQDLPNMRVPDLQSLASLPDYEAIKAASADVARLRAEPKSVRLHLGGLNRVTVAWARAQLLDDRDKPPLPQAFPPEDYFVGQVPAGHAVLLSGILADLVKDRIRHEEGDDEVWYRGTLVLDNAEDKTLVMHLIAPDWALPDAGELLGKRVNLFGRYLARADLADAGGREQEVPVLAVLSAGTPEESDVVHLLDIGELPRESDEISLVGVDREAVFSGIDDIEPVLELRPYYYLLGQARLDRSTPGVYDEAPSAHAISYRIHADPDAWRGEPMQMEGKVWDAWEDDQVSRDQPYDIQRVVRIWAWKVVYPATDRPFYDLYEIAAIVPEGKPVPVPGDRVAVTGRFLKMHAYRTDKHPQQDMMNEVIRHSRNVYFTMLVAGDYTLLPPLQPPDFSLLGVPLWILFLSVALSFALWMGYLIRHEHRTEDKYKKPVRRLRAGRRKLKLKRGQAASQQAQGDETPEERADAHADTPASDDGPDDER